ncbi:MAG: hypothetical protein ABGW77_00320 [Campylobacterales bacterium]
MRFGRNLWRVALIVGIGALLTGCSCYGRRGCCWRYGYGPYYPVWNR